MSRIKSALELALEKTEGVESNSEKLREHERRQDGKRLLAKFYQQLQEGIETKQAQKQLKKGFSDYPAHEQQWVRQGFREVLLAGLTLPQDDSSLSRLDTTVLAAVAASSKQGSVETLFEQTQQIFSQYLQEKTQLIENLRQQFAPRIRQKEEAYAKQTGQRITIDPASDPEFQQYLQQAMEQLQDHYMQVVQQIRDQLSQLL